MPKQLFVRGTLLSDVARLCGELDVDTNEMFRRAGLSHEHLHEPDIHISIDSIVELLEVVAYTAALEDFGLRVAQARGLPDLGPVSLLLRESATVREAIRTLARSLFLHSDGIYVLPEFDADPPIVMVNIINQKISSCRQGTELALTGITQIFRWMLGSDWSPVEVYFMHSRPRSLSSHQAIFRCPLRFESEFNGLILHPNDLDRKLPASSPVFSRQVDRYIKLIEPKIEDPFVYRLTRLITAALPRGEGDAVTIASKLGSDRRTMNRRLARNGLNFSRVIDDVRRSLAAQHLLGSDKSLSEVADLLGFASLSAFSRWHRRTIGLSASEWRRQHR